MGMVTMLTEIAGFEMESTLYIPCDARYTSLMES